MGAGMSEIAPRLFLGSLRDAKNTDAIRDNGITHILSCVDERSLERFVREEKGMVSWHPTLEGVFTHHTDTGIRLGIPANDHPQQNLSVYFRLAAEFIHEARQNGGNVLVHCMAGISRSSTLCVAYLLGTCDWDMLKIINAIRAKRSQIEPNAGFFMQLSKLSNNAEERRALQCALADMTAQATHALAQGNEAAFMEESLIKAAERADAASASSRRHSGKRSQTHANTEPPRAGPSNEGEGRSNEVRHLLMQAHVSSDAISKLEANGLLKLEPLEAAFRVTEGPGSLTVLLQNIGIDRRDAAKVRDALVREREQKKKQCIQQ